MNPSLPPSGCNKKRFGQLDLYTYGDPEFRKVLIDSMVDNLQELQLALYVANEQLDPTVFHRACHKTNTTLMMLDCMELSNLITELKNNMEGRGRIASFYRRCGDLINSLREEKNSPG